MANNSLAGKIGIVTGAGNGIGRAIAFAMAKAGAKIAVIDLLADAGERVAHEIVERGGDAISFRADVSDEAQVRVMADRTVAKFGGIDLLINNAGSGGISARLHEVPVEDFDRTIATNLRSVFLGAKFVIPQLLQRGGGSIVNISSTYGLVAAPNAPAYCAAKAAIVNLTRQLALDYGLDCIRVNAIAPGYIDTGMRRHRAELSEKDFAAARERREKAARMQPLGRQGTPEEIAEAALFLCSDAAAFITGAVLTVDGGCLTTFNYGAASN